MVIKNQQYVNAIKLLNGGKYDEAIPAFENLLHYKNADEEIKETHYRNGTKLLKNSELEKAIKQLQQVLEYKDSKKLIDKTHYQIGTKLMNDKDYLMGIASFKKITKENIELYSNAQKNIEKCKKQYDKAVAEKVAAAKVAAEKVIADKEVTDRAVANKLAADKILAEYSKKELALNKVKAVAESGDKITLLDQNLNRNGKEYFVFSRVDSGGGEGDMRFCVEIDTLEVYVLYVDDTFTPYEQYINQ